jgi:hypothetical protein
MVSALINSFASAPISIFVAAEAKAKYKLKLISEMAFDRKNPLYMAAKSTISNKQSTLLSSQTLETGPDPSKGEMLLLLGIVHRDPDSCSVNRIGDTLGEKGRYHWNEHSLRQQSEKTVGLLL